VSAVGEGSEDVALEDLTVLLVLGRVLGERVVHLVQQQLQRRLLVTHAKRTRDTHQQELHSETLQKLTVVPERTFLLHANVTHTEAKVTL
jgi:hypothetical protein